MQITPLNINEYSSKKKDFFEIEQKNAKFKLIISVKLLK